MDIRLLRYFLAVAREENITRAAESLHIAQPSLSKQLTNLEQELGKKLLIRGKRKITLTEDGILLRRRADEIVALLEKTEREISSDISKTAGKLPLAVLLQGRYCSQRQHLEPKPRTYSFIFTAVMPPM